MKKNIFNYLVVFFIICSSILFFFGLFNYNGNKYYYILFSFLFNFSLVNSLTKNNHFFDIFFSLLIWLGFWFKFTVQISFLNYQFPEGAGTFDFKNDSFDNVLLISSFCCFSYLVARFSKFFIIKKKHFKNEINLEIAIFYYNKNRKKFLITVFILILLFSALNYIFGFYQKGLIQNTLPLNLNFLFNWLLNFGFASLFTFIIFFEITNKLRNKFDPIYLGLLECFVSSISQLSRGMIFNGLSLIVGLFKYEYINEKNIHYKKYFKYICALFLLFIISVYSVNIIRQSKGYTMAEVKKIIDIDTTKENFIFKEFTEDIEKETNQILFLISGRWVGIEGLMSTYSHKEKGMELIINSLSEKFNYSNSFYENTIKRNYHSYSSENKLYTVYTPGLFGYLYYSNSITFLFFSIFIIVWICYLVEILVRKLSYNNLIFCSLIGNILAYRLAHFGYMPLNSYKLLIAIIVNLIIYHIFIKFILNYFNENTRS